MRDIQRDGLFTQICECLTIFHTLPLKMVKVTVARPSCAKEGTLFDPCQISKLFIPKDVDGKAIRGGLLSAIKSVVTFTKDKKYPNRYNIHY